MRFSILCAGWLANSFILWLSGAFLLQSVEGTEYTYQLLLTRFGIHCGNLGMMHDVHSIPFQFAIIVVGSHETNLSVPCSTSWSKQ